MPTFKFNNICSHTGISVRHVHSYTNVYIIFGLQSGTYRVSVRISNLQNKPLMAQEAEAAHLRTYTDIVLYIHVAYLYLYSDIYIIYTV